MSALKKKRRLLYRRKRTLDPMTVIDYKNPDMLRRFVTDRGKIIPRRISGATAAQQRMITLQVKRARFLALLPFSQAHRTEKGFAGDVMVSAPSYGGGGRYGGGGGGSRYGGGRDDRGPRDRDDRGPPRDRDDRGPRDRDAREDSMVGGDDE